MPTVEDITRAIRDASDIVDVVGQYVNLKRGGRDLKGLCPFHKEKSPSFHVRPAEQYFKCFGCGAGGDVFNFMQQYHSIGFVEARQMLADRAGITVEAADRRRGGGRSSRSELLRVNRWARDVFRSVLTSDEGAQARDYLANRGIDDAMQEQFGLGLAPDSFEFLLKTAGRSKVPHELLVATGLAKERNTGNGLYDGFRNRLMFPILDPVGQVVGFGGRALGDDPAKYINSPESPLFNKRKLLYGIDLCREGFHRGRAILVEGYTDVILAHSKGFNETVAALGTSLTDEHAEVLARYVPRVILVFDGDEAGARAAERGLHIALRCQLEVSLVALPAGQDPCDYLISQGAEAFEAALNSAPSALEFKWSQTLRGHHHGGSSSEKHRAVQEFVSYVGASAAYGAVDVIQRGIIVNQLSKLLGVGRKEVQSLLTTAQHRVEPGPSESASMEAHSASLSRPRSSEEAACLDLLAALIRQPEVYPRVVGHMPPAVFSDDRVREIAEKAMALAAVGHFSAADLLDHFEDPQDASCVVELLERGRFCEAEAQVDAALERLDESKKLKLSYEKNRELRVANKAEDRAKCLGDVYDVTRDYAEAPRFAGVAKLGKTGGFAGKKE